MRPKNADSAVTFDRIVDAALAEIESVDDPMKVSLRAVSRRAEVSLGTIHYYFESRSELFEHCLDAHYQRLSGIAQELIQRNADLPADDETSHELIEHAVRTLFRFASGERASVRLRALTNARSGQLHPRRQADMLDGLVGVAAEALQPRVEIGLLDTRVALALISVMLMRVVVMTDQELSHVTGADPTRARELAEDAFVRTVGRMLRPSDDWA